MEQLVKIAIIWIVCGNIAYVINQRTPKLPGEEPISYGRCIVGGIVMLVAVIFGWLATDSNDEEDKLY